MWWPKKGPKPPGINQMREERRKVSERKQNKLRIPKINMSPSLSSFIRIKEEGLRI